MTIKLVRTLLRPNTDVAWLPVGETIIPWLRTSSHCIEFTEEESLDGLSKVETFLLDDAAEEMIINNVRTAEQTESKRLLDEHNLAHDINVGSEIQKI